jgi:hypothetical protein
MEEFKKIEIETGGKGKGDGLKVVLATISDIINDDKKYSWKIKFKEIKGD